MLHNQIIVPMIIPSFTDIRQHVYKQASDTGQTIRIVAVTQNKKR